MEPLVCTETLTKRYGGVTALDRVSFTIHSGATGLLGPNGAGKTTLIRILLGLTPPTSGRVSALGFPLPRGRMDVRRRVGYSPEIEAHFPAMTAIDAVTFAGCLSGMPKTEAFKRAHQVLHAVGLDEARYRKIDGFSTGMKQRVKIAQALVHDPELLILDEPTSGLDATGRDEILDLIHRIARDGRPSVILSTHILADVERVCSRAVILHHGRLLGAGPLDELMAGVRGTFDVRIDGDAGAFARELDRHGIECRPGPGGLLHLRSNAGALRAERVFASAVACGVSIRHFAPSRISLDDAFLRMVG